MIRSYQFWLAVALLVSAAKSEVLRASNLQICTDLCSDCGGTPTFSSDICDCRVADNDEKGAECIKHMIKRQSDNFNLDQMPDQENANRETRCSLPRSRKRMRSDDIDHVVNYFVNSGPMGDLPRLGTAKSNCDASEDKSAANHDSKSDKKVNPLTDKRGSARKSEETVPTKGNDTPVDSSPKSSGRRENNLVATPRILESRSLFHRHGLLGVIPNVLLEIPQAIASAIVPRYGGAHYTPLFGVPQNSHFLGGSQHPYLLGSVATGTPGIIRNNNDAVPAYVPAIDHGNMVPPMQSANPSVGIPNALLAGVETPSYYPGLYRATHYAPVLGAATPQPSNAIGGNPNADYMKTTEQKSAQSEASQLPQLKIKENPTALHKAIAQQNSILESLSQQLRNYAPQAPMPNYQYSPMPYGMLGAPNPMPQCYCNDQGSAIVGTSRSLFHRRKPTAEEETAPQPKAVQDMEVTVIPPTKEQSEENNDEASNVKIARSSRQLTVKKEECDWQCVTNYLDKLDKDGYSTYRTKRGNAEYAKKSDEIVLQSETL